MFSFIEPVKWIAVRDGVLNIRWDDQDPDSSAKISLYYTTLKGETDGTLIVDNLEEDSDEAGDMYRWVVAQMPPGRRYLYAVIDDGFNVTTVHHRYPVWIGKTKIFLDNNHPDVEKIGDWIPSTDVSGFYGEDYLYLPPDGPSPDALLIDNLSQGYSTTGEWIDATRGSGYYGTNYQYHQPNGLIPESIVIDNLSPAFSTQGAWPSSTFKRWSSYGEDYRYAAPNSPLPAGILIDNSDPTVQLTGSWTTENLATDQHGADYLISRGTWRSRGEDTITWPVTTTGSGRYRVYARWPQHGTADRKAPYTIQHDGGVTTVEVNQRNSGGGWVLLGSFDYSQGTQYDITLSNDTGRYVIADAIKLVPEDEVAHSATWTFTPEQSGMHRLFVRWPAYPDRAANAHYRVSDDRGTRSLILNQRKAARRWHLLGDFEFTQGQDYPITLAGHGDGYVIADAIQVVPVAAEPNRASWHLMSPTVAPTGSMPVGVTATAMRAMPNTGSTMPPE